MGGRGLGREISYMGAVFFWEGTGVYVGVGEGGGGVFYFAIEANQTPHTNPPQGHERRAGNI